MGNFDSITSYMTLKTLSLYMWLLKLGRLKGDEFETGRLGNGPTLTRADFEVGRVVQIPLWPPVYILKLGLLSNLDFYLAKAAMGVWGAAIF